MVRIIMLGCNGKMGRVITDIVSKDDACEIVAGIDYYDGIPNTYPVFKNIEACDVEADVVIDFSSVNQLEERLNYCEAKNLPLVLCTTGLSEEQLALVKAHSEKTAVLRSANMSLGINMLIKELKNVATILAPAGFDIEIVEKHHNQKVDAPSGTALALADSINAALDDAYTYTYDRSQERKKRDAHEIGISAVRGGSIVGEHEIIFAGNDEVITITHTAYSKALFANGAVQAAKFLAGKPAGMYDMSQVVG